MAHFQLQSNFLVKIGKSLWKQTTGVVQSNLLFSQFHNNAFFLPLHHLRFPRNFGQGTQQPKLSSLPLSCCASWFCI